MRTERVPRVGVGVIVRKNGRVLLGKRRGAHGAGTWSFPGGHLEFNESIEHCARREVAEETGIRIKNLRLTTFVNTLFKKEGKHYVTVFVTADYAGGRVTTKEPEKCDGWQWFKPSALPHPLFEPIPNLLRRLARLPR